ncbi:MAG: hypothetical protein ABIJ21_00260 [Nanoarchaeota archaeon]
MGVQVLRSFAALHEYCHEHEGIERVLDARSEEFCRRDGCLYNPGLAFTRIGLVDPWNDFYAHANRVKQFIVEDDLLFEEKLKFGKGVVFHGAQVNIETAKHLKRTTAGMDRDLFLDYYFLSSYLLDTARDMRAMLVRVGEDELERLVCKMRDIDVGVAERKESIMAQAYLAAKERIPFLAKILRFTPQAVALEEEERRIPELEELIRQDSGSVDEALAYIDRICFRLAYEIANTTNQLAYSRVNLTNVLKQYLLDETLQRAETEPRVPGIFAKSCRIASILCDDPGKRMGLLKRGLEIRKQYGNCVYEDNIENAYFHLHLTSQRFLRESEFDNENWKSFLDNLEEAITRMGQVQGNVPANAGRVLHYLLFEAYEFFAQVGAEKSFYLSRFAKASIADVDDIIIRHHRAFDRMLIPLDRFPKAI